MVHATLCLATGEELEDHHGWLQDAPKGHLNAFRGRRDEAPEDQTYNQDEFDPGESFMAKAKGLSQLALQRAKLLNEGRHVEQKLKMINSKIMREQHRKSDFKSSIAGAAAPSAQTLTAFDKAQMTFAHAMAVESSHHPSHLSHLSHLSHVKAHTTQPVSATTSEDGILFRV